MTRIRRGGYVFIAWKGDHTPRHVHVYRDGRLIVKWNLEANLPMRSRVGARMPRTLLELLRELQREVLL